MKIKILRMENTGNLKFSFGGFLYLFLNLEKNFYFYAFS